MPSAPLLSQEEIDDRLKQRPAWRQLGRYIVRDLEFPSFKDTMAFANRVAEAAEEMDHHPDFSISYKTMSLSITTHVAWGLTRRDFRLAEKIDYLVGEN